MEDHPSNTIPTLWKEAIELFKAEADLSDREIADLESSHTPGEVFQDVAHSPWGKSSKKELRRRVSIQKTITVVLNVFGVLDTALNLAQTVQVSIRLRLPSINRHSQRSASFQGPSDCFSG